MINKSQECRRFAGFPAVAPPPALITPQPEGRPLIVPNAYQFRARLELEGRCPIPLAFRPHAWLRGDGSLIVEGEASAEEDLTLMIGAPGRINLNHEGVRLGVRIAATDPDHGIVRFLVQPRIIL